MAINALAAIAFYGTGKHFLFWLCIIVAAISLWSWGIMHNYAMESAKTRWDRLRENMIAEGRSAEEINRLDNTPIHLSNVDINSVPDWITMVNMVVTFAGLGLLVWGIIERFL